LRMRTPLPGPSVRLGPPPPLQGIHGLQLGVMGPEVLHRAVELCLRQRWGLVVPGGAGARLATSRDGSSRRRRWPMAGTHVQLLLPDVDLPGVLHDHARHLAALGFAIRAGGRRALVGGAAKHVGEGKTAPGSPWAIPAAVTPSAAPDGRGIPASTRPRHRLSGLRPTRSPPAAPRPRPPHW